MADDLPLFPSTNVGMRGIDPDVVWAKLASLAQGAEIASARLF